MQTYRYDDPARPLRFSQLRGILLLLGILLIAFLYKITTTYDGAAPDPAVQRAQSRYEQEKILYRQEKIQLQREKLRRNDRLKFYSIISLVGVINLAVLIIAAGVAAAKMRSASVYTAQIGDHSTIPIRYKDLPRFYPIAANLSRAEIEASMSTSHEKAFQMSRQMLQDVSAVSRAFSNGNTNSAKTPILPAAGRHALSEASFLATPTFAELLRNDTLAAGKPLIIGYAGGQPQHRELHELKSVAVAGWQGSGKTLSMAYLIASAILAYRVTVYIIDPHRQHEESLAGLIHPLKKTGLVKIINPFDTPQLVNTLNQTLDRRLSGQESGEQGILVVIDELARLAKMTCFEELLRFIERCTEETRKANITFLGSSPKWTARHFKGRADIRGSMNSMLIHKTKPSQADLLLEDAQEKHLVKHLRHPGDAILVTDYTPPVLVNMPRCTRQDMETVASMVSEPQQQKTLQDEMTQGNLQERKSRKTEKAAQSGIISLAPHRKQGGKISHYGQLTAEIIREQILYRKQQEPGLTQAEIARKAGIPAGTLSKILHHRIALHEEHQRKLFDVLFETNMSTNAEQVVNW